MVALVEGPDVVRGGGAAGGVVVGVVFVGFAGGSAAAGVAAGSVADLDVASQGCPGEPIAGAAVEHCEPVSTIRILTSDVRYNPTPRAALDVTSGEPQQGLGVDV